MATYTVNPGDNLRSIVAGSAAGDTFYISGTHRLQSCQPKNNQRFIGINNAVMIGAFVQSSWTYEAGPQRWYCTGQTQDFGTTNYTSVSSNMDFTDRSEMLYRDDRALERVLSINSLGANNWFFDYAADRIYIKWNPSGRKVEITGDCGCGVGVGQYAFQSNNASDVLIENLTIEKYATQTKLAAIRTFGNRWTVQDCTVRWNFGIGIGLGFSQNTGHTVRRCLITENLQLGVSGGGKNWLLEYCEVSYNNPFNWFEVYWEAGSSKWAQCDGITIQHCSFHHNTGRGPWMDYGCTNFIYQFNLIYENSDDGIYHEINVGQGEIRNNYLFRNGRRGANSGSGQRAQIWLGTSDGVVTDGLKVHHNHCVVWSRTDGTDYGAGICASDQNRTDNPTIKMRRSYIYENKVFFEGRGNHGLIKYPTESSNDLFTTNRFNFNTYYVTSSSQPNFSWNVQDTDRTYKTFAQYQAMDAVRADPNSTLVVGLPAGYDTYPDWSMQTGLVEPSEGATGAPALGIEVIRSADYYRPSPGTPLNRADPLTRGLLFLTLPGNSSRNEYIMGDLGFGQSGGDWGNVSPRGEAFRAINATNSGAYWPFNDRLLDVGTEHTIVVMADIEGQTQYGALLSVPHTTGWATPFAGLKFSRWTATDAEYSYQNAETKYAVLSDNNFMFTGQGVRLYSVVRRGTTVSFYLDGRKFGADKTLSASLSPEFPNRQPVTVMSRSSTSGAFEGTAGTIYIAAIWNRALTEDEMRRIYNDPYTLLRSPALRTQPSLNPTSHLETVRYGEPTLLSDGYILTPDSLVVQAGYGDVEMIQTINNDRLVYARLPERVKPPAASRFQADHPLARDLLWYVTPGGASRHNHLDTTQQGAVGGTNPASWDTVVTPWGAAGSTTAAANSAGLYWPFVDRLKDLRKNFTLAVLVQVDSSPNSSGKILSIPFSSGWSTPFSALGLTKQGTGTSTSTMRLEWSDTAAAYVSATSDSGAINVASDGLMLYVATRDGASVTFYRDGVKAGNTITVANNNDIDPFRNNQPITLMARSSTNNGAEGITGHIIMAGIWGRALAAEDVWALYQDPFAVIRQPILRFIPGIDAFPDGYLSQLAYGAPTLVAGEASVSPSSHLNEVLFEDDNALVAGSVTILADGLDVPVAYGPPTLVAGEVVVNPDGHSSQVSYGGATLVPGAVTLSPASHTSQIEYGNATLVAGGVTVSADGHLSQIEYGDPALVAGAVTVSLASHTSQVSYGEATLVAGGVMVTPDSHVSQVDYGGPALVAGGLILSPDGAAVPLAYGSPELMPGGVTVSPSGHVAQISYGEPEIIPTDTGIYLTSHISQIEYGSPALVAGGVTVSPDGHSVPIGIGEARLDLTIFPDGHGAQIAYGDTTLVAGGVTVSPDGYAVPVGEGAPALVPGAVTLSPDSHISGVSYGGAILVPGGVTVGADGHGVGISIGQPSVIGEYTITAGGHAVLVDYGEATLIPGGVTVAPDGYAVPASIGGPTLIPVNLPILVDGHVIQVFYGDGALYDKVAGNVKIAGKPGHTVKVNAGRGTVKVTMTPSEVDA